jgi:cytochrome c-type protein NapC
MSQETARGKRPGFIRRIWRGFWSPAKALSLGFLLIFGIALGVAGWGGFNWALEITNTEEFCISCHEMRDNVYAEYEGSIHQYNASGVRATCPDCHVPKEWGPKVLRKIRASAELYGHFVTGVIDTPEKFNEHRIDLAERVWRTMKATDSHECRNCHKFDFMDFMEQGSRAAGSHEDAMDEGKTCIDCHQGIAHKLPDGYQERYNQVVEELAANGELPAAPGVQVAETEMTGLRTYLSGAATN